MDSGKLGLTHVLLVAGPSHHFCLSLHQDLFFPKRDLGWGLA